MLEDLEKKVEVLTGKMYDEGNDAKTVDKILKDREGAEARISTLYEEVRKLLELKVPSTAQLVFSSPRWGILTEVAWRKHDIS